jgi:curli biogenesis system outer membrane secretion channel CsgG
MNRSVNFLGLVFVISVAPLFFNAWGAGARPSYRDQSAKKPPVADATQKKRIVVLDFDDSAVGTTVLGDQVDVGKAISALLAQQLAKDGTYAVTDAKTLALAEQNFSRKDRADREFAVKFGKRLAADAVIMGSVTLFGRDPHERPFPQDEVVPRKIKARVAAEARIIDVATGEIVAVASGRAESKRTGVSLTSGGNWHGFGGGNVDFGSSEFQATILGEAVNDAVQQLTANLVADASQLSSAPSKP